MNLPPDIAEALGIGPKLKREALCLIKNHPELKRLSEHLEQQTLFYEKQMRHIADEHNKMKKGLWSQMQDYMKKEGIWTQPPNEVGLEYTDGVMVSVRRDPLDS